MSERILYENLTQDAERALYQASHADVRGCSFEGPADGESALKECTDIRVSGCRFLLRYPLWHTHGGILSDSTMTDACRAALWYDHDLEITRCSLGGIKALRECDRVRLTDCAVNSAEFGWSCRDLTVKDCSLVSEYPFMRCERLNIDGLTMKGKYSFQYVHDAVITNSYLDTKDAFWHARRVTVRDSVIKGEYLGWYAEDLTLIRCKIIGTQPLCYVKNLLMLDCETVGCDFSFENSTVQAEIRGDVTSIRSPAGGRIVCDGVGEILHDYAPVDGSGCEIVIRSAKAERSDMT
ncbi:MAG: DUF3737 family protein [Clostridia bacterium]|nr:DUF3737 family protein [Clostridia bacterium]